MNLTEAQNTHLGKLAQSFGIANAEAVAKDNRIIRALGTTSA
jgi:hypothetical protein